MSVAPFWTSLSSSFFGVFLFLKLLRDMLKAGVLGLLFFFADGGVCTMFGFYVVFIVYLLATGDILAKEMCF